MTSLRSGCTSLWLYRRCRLNRVRKMVAAVASMVAAALAAAPVPVLTARPQRSQSRCGLNRAMVTGWVVAVTVAPMAVARRTLGGVIVQVAVAKGGVAVSCGVSCSEALPISRDVSARVTLPLHSARWSLLHHA